jgi:hypothetical protein
MTEITSTSGRGRPKGSKNKPKRGRPKGSKKNKQPLSQSSVSATKVAEPQIIASVDEQPINSLSERDSLDSYLDDAKFKEEGYNIDSEKIINNDPIDTSFFYRGSKHVPVAGAQYEFTADMIQEMKKCKDDIVYFAENYFFIVSLDRGKEKISLYEAQKRVLRTFVRERHAIVCSSRQIGKSTMLTVFSLWMVCFNTDYRAAIVANKETTAINIFKRIRMAYEQLPNFIKPGVKEYGKTGMTLGNDSSIIVSTTTATSIRGDSLNCVLLDEAAYIESHLLEDFWSSVIPTVSSGKNSKILVVSTPNGVGNKFYEIYSGAESGNLKQWKSERIDWWDVPGRDEEWKATQIELIGSEEKFLEEYNNTFLDEASSAVGASVIESFKQNKQEPIWTSEEGDYVVYENPDEHNLYVIGVDVGEGIGRASSVAQVLDVTDLQNIKQVAVFGSSRIEPYQFANKLLALANSWGVPPMLIERNNCGAQLIDALFHHHKYEKLVSYSKISEQDRYNKTRNIGVLSHTNIRFDGIQNMRYWVNHLQAVAINDANTISEFETFVRFPNGKFRKKNDTFFDDRIMALVWALFILTPEICQEYFTIVDFDDQQRPLKIETNGYWEIDSEKFLLKELEGHQRYITTSTKKQPDLAFPALGVSQREIENLDKYNLDIDQLLENGFEFFDTNPPNI